MPIDAPVTYTRHVSTMHRISCVSRRISFMISDTQMSQSNLVTTQSHAASLTQVYEVPYVVRSTCEFTRLRTADEQLLSSRETRPVCDRQGSLTGRQGRRPCNLMIARCGVNADQKMFLGVRPPIRGTGEMGWQEASVLTGSSSSTN